MREEVKDADEKRYKAESDVEIKQASIRSLETDLASSQAHLEALKTEIETRVTAEEALREELASLNRIDYQVYKGPTPQFENQIIAETQKTEIA